MAKMSLLEQGSIGPPPDVITMIPSADKRLDNHRLRIDTTIDRMGMARGEDYMKAASRDAFMKLDKTIEMDTPECHKCDHRDIHVETIMEIAADRKVYRMTAICATGTPTCPKRYDTIDTGIGTSSWKGEYRIDNRDPYYDRDGRYTPFHLPPPVSRKPDEPQTTIEAW